MRVTDFMPPRRESPNIVRIVEGLTGRVTVRSELQESQGALLAWMERAVPGMPPKAARWVGEMEEIADTFADAGAPAGFHRAAAEVYRG